MSSRVTNDLDLIDTFSRNPNDAQQQLLLEGGTEDSLCNMSHATNIQSFIKGTLAMREERRLRST